tara:strand:+ start:392 stop:1420 length:1029 start_codon:yes stop_codon:yes gene_type:complete
MARKTKKYEKLYTKENFDEMKADQLSTLKSLLDNPSISLNNTPQHSGVFQLTIPEVDVSFIKPDSGVTTIASNGAQTAQLILGRDRPADLVSGYGGVKGAQRCNTFDIVVGRKSSLNQGKGPKDGQPVDNDFCQDAARIYISEMTDVDLNFGLSANNHARMAQGKASIALKADQVRMIGREGIKIVTGKANGFANLGKDGELNSKGGSIVQPCPPIELNAGNVSGTRTIMGGILKPNEEINLLQPITMGENTRDAFMELSAILDDLMGAIFSFATIQTTLNGVLGVTPLPHHVAACSAATTALTTQVVSPLYHTRVNKVMWEVNYLEKFGQKYVCSKNVFTS